MGNRSSRSKVRPSDHPDEATARLAWSNQSSIIKGDKNRTRTRTPVLMTGIALLKPAFLAVTLYWHSDGDKVDEATLEDIEYDHNDRVYNQSSQSQVQSGDTPHSPKEQVDARGDLLSDIRRGKKLRKVQQEAKNQEHNDTNGVETIFLSRIRYIRVSVAFPPDEDESETGFESDEDE